MKEVSLFQSSYTVKGEQMLMFLYRFFLVKISCILNIAVSCMLYVFWQRFFIYLWNNFLLHGYLVLLKLYKWSRLNSKLVNTYYKVSILIWLKRAFSTFMNYTKIIPNNKKVWSQSLQQNAGSDGRSRIAYKNVAGFMILCSSALNWKVSILK